nr:hypothetical protein [Tanacetum cinerariifolium]
MDPRFWAINPHGLRKKYPTSIRKGQKLHASGMEVQDIKDKLRAVGGVAAKKDLIDKWIEDYESREKDELFHIIRNRTTILKQQRLLDEQTEIIAERQNLLKYVRDLMKEAKAFIEKANSNYVVDDKSAPAADDEGLSDSKKRSTLLDGPSPKDYDSCISKSSSTYSAHDVMKEAKDFIEKDASNSIVDDESAPAADDEGLPGSKKCSTLLDGPSPKD